MLPNVLHSLSKHIVISDFEEIFLKVVVCLSSQTSVEIYVRFQPCSLVKLDNLITLLEDESLIQCFYVNNIILLIIQVRNQLSDSADYHIFAHKQKAVMQIM